MTQTINALADAVDGEVLFPESPGYESARLPRIARFRDIRPQAVVRCRTPDDVAATLAFARSAGLPLVPRSGGHCFAGRSSTEGIVLDVSPMRDARLADGVATVGGGARLADVYDALAPEGVTIPMGCGPTVGIAGLTLGGGIGVLGRKYGLTCDNLIAADVVLADGRQVTCDAEQHADLFWALRGGGPVGVVTRLTFRTVPALPATAIHVTWPHTHAAALLDAWQAWAPDAPAEIAASLLVTASAEADEPPRAHLFGAMQGGEADTVTLIEPMLDVAEPATSTFTHAPYREVKRHLAEHGPGEGQPELTFSKSQYYRRPLPIETIDALVRQLVEDRRPGEARELDFMPMGGAYNRVPADATAFVHRDERYLLKQTVAADDGEAGWLAGSWAITEPHGTGAVYPNFPEPDLPQRAYHGANLERLLQVRAAYDPDGVFG